MATTLISCFLGHLPDFFRDALFSFLSRLEKAELVSVLKSIKCIRISTLVLVGPSIATDVDRESRSHFCEFGLEAQKGLTPFFPIHTVPQSTSLSRNMLWDTG